MMRYRRGVPVPHLQFRNGADVEDWLNAESPDTWPYSRKITCERIALALKLLDVVEEEVPQGPPPPYDFTAEEQVLSDALDAAKRRLMP